MALTSAQRVELIQKMYVAYYGRPADTGGLDNWVNHLVQHNDDASAIIEAFGTSPEATSLYGEPVNYALAVNALYMQMFNRPAEPDGLALYVAHLNAGRVTLPNLALTIATGAQNSDRDTFLNKVEVATAFTAEVATSTENILGYAGEDAAAHAAAFLAAVTAADASVTAALANLESTIDTIIGLDQLSSLPTHMLTTGLDNLLGTNGNDVVLAVLDGSDSTLELDDAFNSLLGQDTLRLDAVVGGAENELEFDSADYHMVGFERVLVQARADDVYLTLDLADMAGVDLEVRNMIGYDADLEANNVDGDVLVVNFDGYDLDLNNVSGDVAIRDLQINSGYGDVNIFNVDGDLLIEDFNINESVEIGDVLGNIVLTGNLDSEGDINSNITGDLDMAAIGGNVTISNVDFDNNINISGMSGNTVTFNNVDINDNIDIYFADTVTSATINLNGLDALEGEYIDVDGDNVTNYTINVTADSDINDLHFSHENDSLSQITINLTGADLYIEDLNVASQDADENDIPSTLTINGTGNLTIDGLGDDDNVDIVYTGSGSIDIGSEGEWEPGNGSFNASTATGAVTIELDLTEESDIDFTYVGSKGNDRVTIEEDTLGTAAADDNTVALSLAGGTGVDTFVVSDDSDLTAEALALVSGFEVLELANSVEDEGDNAYIDSVFAEEFDTEGLATGRVYDLEDADEFSSVVVDTQGSDENLALINLTAQQATNLTFKYDAGDQLNGLIVDLENQTGVSDVVSMTIVTDESSGDYSDLEGDFAEGYMFINDVETINFNITGDAFYKDGNGDYITDGDSIFVGIDGLVADEVEKINITGTVNFGIGSIGYTEYDFVDGNEPNSDLREIDATGFTGEQLVLGGFMGPIGIFTEDDLIINGSRVSNHLIAAMSTEDITVTTGSGNDAMYLMAQNDIIVNSGSGNDDINVNANGDVIVNTAEGDDNVFVDAAIDATITMGAGNDEFDYNYNDIDGDLTVDAGAGDDDININLDSDGNLDSATVTLGSGADNLYLGSTRFDADNDFVVTVTDFAAAADVLYFDEDAEGVEWSGDGDAYEADYVTVGTQDGDYDVTDGVSSDDIGLIEFTFDADNNGVELDIASTGADLLEALGDDGDSAIITVNNDQDGYIVAYNGGNAYIFNYETDIDGLPTATEASGDGEDNQATITFTEGTGDGWEAGDVITISGVVVTEGSGEDSETFTSSGSFTYTVEADDTITDIANAIASGINNYTNSDITATFAAGVVTVYDGSNEYDVETMISVSFTEATETDTVIQDDQIELIGVLENVAVGSLSTANFGFYDWTVA